MMDDEDNEVPHFSDSDDDYDTHNDETFGNETEEFKWEDTQEPAYEFVDEEPRALDPNVVNKDGDSMNVNLSYEDGKFGNENELEASISRLVMEEYDFDDTDEEELAAASTAGGRVENKSKNQPVFTPNQVVDKQYSWLAEQESPGDSSLLVGSSVWSMHPTGPTQAQRQKSQPTLNETQSASTAKLSTISNSNSSANVKTKKESFSNKPTLNCGVPKELRDLYEPGDTTGKRQVIGYSAAFGTLYADSPAVNVKTVCEIESELLGESEPPKPKPKLPPPEKTAFGHISDPLLFNEMSYIAYSTVKDPNKINAGPLRLFADQADHFGPRTNNRQSTQPLKPRNVEVQDNQAELDQYININQPMGHGQGMGFAPASPPKFPQIRRGRGRAVRPPGYRGRGDNCQGPNMMPPRMPGLPPLQQQQPMQQQTAMQQQKLARLIRINQSAGPFRPPYLPNWRNTIYNTRGIYKQERPIRYWENSNYPDEYRVDGGWMRPDNDFNNIMTDKDKQRLRNIQMIQLQNDHPYTVDYYFQMKFLKERKITVDSRKDYECFMKLYPAIGTEHARNNYQPTHFENSLGKLQAVSALAPKKAIDTGVVSVENRNSWRSPARSTLLLIERIYSKVLKVEEADFRATLRRTKPDDGFFLARQEELEAALALLEFAGMETVAKYNKGKVLISRIVGVMLPERNLNLFRYVIMNLGNWFNLELEKHEARMVYKSIRNIIMSSDISDLCHFFILFNSNEKAASGIMKSKIGCSLTLCLLHKIETAFDSNGAFIWNGEECSIPRLINEALHQYLHLAVFTKKRRSTFEVFPSLLSLVKRCKMDSADPHVDGSLIAKDRMDYYVHNGAEIYKG